MIRQIIIYLALLNWFVIISPAQEVITGLQSNYQITKTLDNYNFNTTKGIPDTLEIPFFDDFSGNSIFPDTSLWIDNFVFINNTYSKNQITRGIATFDAIDNSGRLYEAASSSSFTADALTSKPLNLNYSAADNIWMSFFYQPGGLSDPPEINDSLTLQFFAPDENKWYSVWRAFGDTVQDFKPVIIRIDQSQFLKKGFQFRFINYATLSPNLSDPSMVGNCDIWNVDYILIDKNRNETDTVFSDVAFTLPLRSLLKSHESMPWGQFRQTELQEMGSVISVNYRNNDIIPRNITRDFEIRDVYRNIQSHNFTAGATNISPLTSENYNANLIYTFSTVNNDSALFRITCSLKTDEFDPKANDTLVYYQLFNNYFAFDDGSSESGYGINGLGSRNAMAAYRFTSFIMDTIRAVKICFNDSYLDANIRTFDLMIWDDNGGFPGNVIYSQEELMVKKSESINGFYTYTLPDGVMVEQTFYVGWKQRSESFLNAGLDLNTPHKGRQLYWLNGDWQQSQAPGSIMIRPVVGKALKITAINDIKLKERNLISVWPNPASDYINIDMGTRNSHEPVYVTIFDIQGREILKVLFNEKIDISSLHEGIYIIVTSVNGIPAGYNRLIKTR
jgi:hypothetical protein